MRVETVTVRILQANIKDFADIVLFENVEKFFRGFFAVTNGEKLHDPIPLFVFAAGSLPACA